MFFFAGSQQSHKKKQPFVGCVFNCAALTSDHSVDENNWRAR